MGYAEVHARSAAISGTRDAWLAVLVDDEAHRNVGVGAAHSTLSSTTADVHLLVGRCSVVMTTRPCSHGLMAMAQPSEPLRTAPDAMSEPAYLALADQLEALVATLAPGDRVPSEHQLIEAHSVSRLTARAALQELEHRFLVRRVRGAGTFVARRIEHRIGPDMPPSGSEAVRRAGGVPGSTLHSVRTRRPTAAVRDALDLDPDERIVAITRAGTVDGLPASYGTSHIPAELVDGIAGHMADGTSIYSTLRDIYGIEPARLWARAEMVAVPSDVAPHLGLEGRPLVWWLESCNHDPRLGRPVELSQSWMRADVYRFVVELGRAE
ncbi:MAG: GntR family transcriptional regulator [Acidimicrobiia bacterium]|nr:GntR family transcriptional regulator [Acidimicrobiia bacterium]